MPDGDREARPVNRDDDLLPASLRAPDGCPRGAEPLAVRGGRDGVVLLHGLTGSPWEVRPIADALVAQGFSVAMPVLAGHATSVRALLGTGWRDWLRSADDALGWLSEGCDRVHFVGLSMGALVGLILAQRHDPAHVGSVVALAPALQLHGWHRAVLLGLHRLGWPAIIGKDAPDLPPDQRPPCYAAIPPASVAELVELQDVVRRTLRPVTAPVLVLHGEADRTIPAAPVAVELGQLLGPTCETHLLPGLGHLLPRTARGSEVVATVVDWIWRRAPTSRDRAPGSPRGTKSARGSGRGARANNG
jgi:carboxylesterase